MIVLAASDTPDNPVLQLLTREEEYVARLGSLHELLTTDAAHFPEVDRRQEIHSLARV